ncbi:MAG TPA: peptidase MA family metallohydrolase [Ktedonobacteraceae bacterium]
MSALVHRLRLPLFFSLYLSIFFLGSFACPGHASALTDPITITSQSYFIHFPDFIDFTVSANDPAGTISSATISITFGPQQDQEQDTGTVTANQPAHSVTLQFKEATTGVNFHPPGTPIGYSWQIADNVGNTYTGPAQQITTFDSRFTWQHLSQGMLQVNWYNRSQDFGQIMLNQAMDSVSRISRRLGGGLLHPINLWIYASDQDFHSSLASGSYEWVGGEAIPPLNEASIVVMDASDTTLVRDMPHELTHLIFHQLTAQAINIPTWFDEGLAVYNQVYHEPEMMQTFDQALASHTLIPLSQLESGFPADANKAYLAYAQSWQLLDYMYTTFGQPTMARLIRQVNSPFTDFDQDLQKVLGEDELHLENHWYLSLHQPPLIPPDQSTPIKIQGKNQGIHPNASTANSYFWLLFGLGAPLILVSLSGLSLLFVNLCRQRNRKIVVEAMARLIAGNTMNVKQNKTGALNGYPDPSTYMRTSMYASLVEQSEPQPPASMAGQEYLNSMPRDQAPQE